MRSYTIRATALPGHVNDVPSRLTEDATWYHGQTINVSRNLLVPAGVTLTIEPGVTVRLPSSAKLRFRVLGTLKAIGNDVYPIEFVVPSPPEQWIEAMGDGRVFLEHCKRRSSRIRPRTRRGIEELRD